MPLSTIKTASLADNAVSTAKMANEALNGRRNLIINGAMQVAQRGTSFTNKSTGAVYRLDRWEVSSFSDGDGEHNISQSTEAPDGFTFSTKIECATQDTSQDANNQFYYQQQIEAQDINHLKFYESNPDSVTLSFHVRSNLTGTFPVALKISDNNSVENNTATRIYQVTYSVSAADTWEKKTVTFPLDSSSQTKPTGNNFGMAVQFWLGAGSSRDGATANAWGDNGNATIAADNLDFLGSTSNEWYLTGVQLEVGSAALPFEYRPYGEELSLCQRYYSDGKEISGGGLAWYYSNNLGYTYARAPISFPTTMRALPTVTVTTNPATPGTARGIQHRTTYGFSAYVNGLGSSDYVEIDEWTADAEL